MLEIVASIAAGFFLLYVAGEALVAGASRLALALRIPPLVVGLTVVAFGTSSPELVVSLQAATSGSSELALGNVIGSNLCNIGLILGLAAVLRPISVATRVVRVDVPILLVVSACLPLAFLDGRLSRLEAGLLCLGLVLYCASTLYLARRETASIAVEPVIGDPIAGPVPTASRRPWLDSLLIVAGLGGLILGGRLFVYGAVALARATGASEAVIGLTVVALGTSLPELAASIVATLRGQSDMAVGNVVGSNLFNLLGILGITGFLHPLSQGAVTTLDLALVVVSALVLLPLLRSGWRLSRVEGGALLAAYLAYVVGLW